MLKLGLRCVQVANIEQKFHGVCGRKRTRECFAKSHLGEIQRESQQTVLSILGLSRW